MTLAFLTTTVAASRPPPVSPLAQSAAAAGATLGLRDGWVTAVRFTTRAREARACTQTLGWADYSALTKLESGGAPRGTPGSATRDAGAWWCPISPGRTLVIASPDRATTLTARLGAQALDVTSQYGALLVAGPAAREAIARFCALDLRPQATPAGGFRPGSIARTPGYILCLAPERYLLLFGAATAEYIWTVVSDAGTELGGHPVAGDVLTLLARASEEAAGDA